ncbi:MAG TPA: cytochrome c [Pyrinomonadaceae bacterium]|nr:cytochrome c [Pyrinomonadaceae bacterium]
MITNRSFAIRFICALCVTAILIFVISCGDQPNANISTSSSNDSGVPTAAPSPDLMATGRKLYTDNCAICHKEDGTGGRIEIDGASITPDDLTSKKIREMDDARIYRYVFEGIVDEGMPAFKDKLSEAEIREVVRYLRIELQQRPEPGSPAAANSSGR